MKARTLFALFFALTIGALGTANAQQPAAARPAAGGAAAGAPAGDAKIGVIYTELFLDQKTGIQRLVTTATGVQREFQPRITELETLGRSIQTATADLEKKASVQDAATSRTESDRIEQLKRDFTRKNEDLELAVNKRRAEALGPISEKINTALQAFARTRGISFSIDGSKANRRDDGLKRQR
jgi:Skp family chaperone for outer membrane proteins